MIDRGKHNVLGVRVNAVDYDAAVNRIVDAARMRVPLAVSAMAVHGLMISVFDSAHRYRLNKFELILPDGQPIRWAMNSLYGTRLADRVYGPNLMLRVCAKAADSGIPIFLFGGSETLLSELQEGLYRRFPHLIIAGVRSSKFRTLTAEEYEDLVAEIRNSGARLTFVGLGCPRQEVFAYEMKEALSMPLLAVGAAFNFHAGQLAQAPQWMQDRGLEWLFRLTCEPRRLWQRYLLLNPIYLTLLALQASGLLTLRPEQAPPPATEICYG